MGSHRRKVWTVVGYISDDLTEGFHDIGVYRGAVAEQRVPPGPFGWGYVVDAATADAARRVAHRLHASYQAGTLDYSVTMVQRGGTSTPDATGKPTLWQRITRRVPAVQPEPYADAYDLPII